MLLVHNGFASFRQFQCVPTTNVNPIKERFSLETFLINFSTTFNVSV